MQGGGRAEDESGGEGGGGGWGMNLTFDGVTSIGSVLLIITYKHPQTHTHTVMHIFTCIRAGILLPYPDTEHKGKRRSLVPLLCFGIS